MPSFWLCRPFIGEAGAAWVGSGQQAASKGRRARSMFFFMAGGEFFWTELTELAELYFQFCLIPKILFILSKIMVRFFNHGSTKARKQGEWFSFQCFRASVINLMVRFF
jgi:hypothetical protein